MMPLQVFEKHPTADAYRVGGFFSPYCLVSKDKRFTEAELAAEFESARCDYMLSTAAGSYWSQLGDTWSHDPNAVRHRSTTLLHFAARPHAHESDYA